MRRKNTTKHMMKGYISESLLILITKKNYTDITIAEITEKAGVNRSTYYRNFSSKEEIVKFYLEQIMNRYRAEYEGLTQKSFEGYLYTMFKHFYLYKSELLALYHNNLSYLILEVLNGCFEQEQSMELKDNKNQFRMFYHVGGIYNFFVLWFSHNMKETPKELTEIAIEIVTSYTKPMFFE